MTRTTEGTRAGAGAAAFLAGLAILLTSPAQPVAASAGCGENSGAVCWENEACVNILFYKQCTTDYKYYPASEGGAGLGGDSGGSGGSGGGGETALEGVEGCTWGRDYLGWAPYGC